ncbi:MAG: hypothetical protein QM762_17740, partial [Chryseolinea sp.]
MAQQTIHAVFVGINAYKQSPLSGCVADVISLDLFLRELVKSQPDNKKINYNPKYFLGASAIDLLRIEQYKDEEGVNIA